MSGSLAYGLFGVLREFADVVVGGSAAAAGSLVEKLGGVLLGYVFILELDFLKGREKLSAPTYTLLSSQETGPKPEPEHAKT